MKRDTAINLKFLIGGIVLGALVAYVRTGMGKGS